MAVKFLGLKTKWIKILIIIGVVIIAMLIYFPDYTKLRRLKEENKRLILENEQFEKEIADYEEKIQRLEKDPYLYEKIARDDLGVAKDNEIVIDIGQ